jgi:hypothetical protein
VSQFTIEHLSERSLAEANAIVALSNHLASCWDDEALALIRRGGGVLAARAADGTVQGIASSEMLDKRHAGRVLAVDRLVAFELSRRQPVRQALIDALQRISEVFGCTAVTGAEPVSRAVRSDDRAARASRSR